MRARRLVRSALGHLGGLLLIVWGAATAGFLAVRAIPGDPVDVMLGVQAQVSESVRDDIRADWGLDQPLIVQYLAYLGRLVRGDLGTSYQLREPVAQVLGEQLPPTLALACLALLFAVTVAVAFVLLARLPGLRGPVSTLELVLVSSPTFWIGLVLITFLSFRLGWFPVAATQGLHALLLPAITLALPLSGILAQVLRQGIESALAQPFALTARARGAGPARLVLHHGLRHAASDGITLTAYLFGSLLGGAVLVESVFGRPGLGRAALRAIIDRDLPVVLGVIVLAAVLFAVVNTVVDLLAPLLDPRQRRTRAVLA